MATQRRAEAGWIEAKGYWEIKVQKDGMRKSFRSSVAGRKGKHEAEAKADKWLATGTAEMRLQAAWDAFMKWQKEHNGTGNYVKLEAIGRLYILPGNKHRKLSMMKPQNWQECIDCAVELGRSKRTCTNIRSTISTFLRFCRRNRWEYIALEDDDLHIPNKAAPAKEKHVLHDEDIRTLFTDPYMVKNSRKQVAHFIHAWRFFVVTGLRRGELIGLKHEDIFDGKIHIRRSINAEGEETHGKNDNARRNFAITSNMQTILRDQAAFMKEKGIESPWVFPDWYGERTVPHALYSSWKAYSGQHGIECTIHELRHTFVSLNKADLPLELLKAVVGHSSSMDTIGVYGHEVDGDQQRTAAIMDEVINKKLQIK